MKRILPFIFALALAPMVSRAQEPQRCLELKNVKIAGHNLRPGNDAHAELAFKARDCQLVDGPEKPIMTLEAESGMSATPSKLRFQHHGAPIAGTTAMKAKELSVEIKLATAWGLPSGEHKVQGVVNYQVVDGTGTIKPESLTFAFPFQVAPARLGGDQNSFVQGLKNTGVVVAEIALFPLIALFMLIYCPISGECPDC